MNAPIGKYTKQILKQPNGNNIILNFLKSGYLKLKVNGKIIKLIKL